MCNAACDLYSQPYVVGAYIGHFPSTSQFQMTRVGSSAFVSMNQDTLMPMRGEASKFQLKLLNANLSASLKCLSLFP